MSKTFHCPSCGAPLQEPDREQGVISCTYCLSSVIVPPELRRSASTEPALSPAESLFNLPELAVSVREAAELTRAGRVEEAVQLLMEKLAMDGPEARRVVAQMEQGQIVQIGEVENRFSSQTFTLSGEDANQIMQLLNKGQEDQALQLYRQITGAGAEDAQRAVAAMRLASRLMEQPTPLNNQQTARIAKGAASIFAFSSCLTFLIISLVSLLTVGIVFWALVSDGGPLESWWLTVNPFGRERVVLSFGKEGIGNGSFDDPRHIAVDPQGNIYVSDYRSGRIQQFDPQGNFLNLWIEEGTPQASTSNKPTIFSLAVSRDGILHIVHDGAIYRRNVADGSSLPPIQLERTSIQQVFLTSTGKIGIVANGDDLALLNANGEVEWMVKHAIENVAGESELTAYLSGDGLGNFYLAGSFTEGVFKYSPEGKFLNRFGSGGDAVNQFRAINAIQVDSQGRIYVSDIKGIMIFNLDGQYLRTLPVPGVAFGMAFGQDDRLYLVTNQPGVLVYQFR
ncbi:protein containing NHL repeat [Bellilinea caldifistulae]|uniref:Tetratrico peptide repeat group 5 domain-containing protein n=1 Tax=Bellilinea caldifistulae TaxID=360411 RepID=A0A0P6Y1D6_9CHLR|nr:tetratricopeptide repeat protein [Bellilinea caldifistulae]KPL75349.1 hypothetical protein AC812_08645 [Bellilinea caldifistulae]GAP09773.1 protein containing NHL repeat [Bellilinea caldifistulae]